MTYSIVARDPVTGSLGVGVQSHYFDVGMVVPWAEAGVGAVATQALADRGYGPRGLALMRDGVAAPDALAQLLAADELNFLRQVAMVDASGDAAAFTGEFCIAEAGEIVGQQVSVQANMMLRPTVWGAMFAAYERANGDLTDRILAALDAAEAEGGDVRGRQSAAILVVDGERSDAPWERVVIDVRVDDHPDPLYELRRLVAYARAFNEMGSVFDGGLLFAPSIDESMTEALELTLGALARGQAVLGDNREPSVWQAVLLLRAGREDEARVLLADAVAVHAGWAEFVRRLARAGMLPDDDALLERFLP